MRQIVTCLWFDTQGEEAATFYTSVVPNSRITKVTPYVVETPGPNPVGSVMTVDFELNGQPYQALNGGPQFTFNEAISIVLPCDSQEESDTYWEALGDGGEFGPCGWLKDKFGLSWQIYPAEMDDLFADPVPERAKAAMEAMLKQSRIDVAEIKAAMDAAGSR
ncbi:VOC family protein [Ornithinimicrobium sp. F0845]|uniref:VOC family protein n=1 Tax=Ornithinimicrobium sp. F0845 TaxID=2926412 RepID=UPI001FF62261|nr:VOC family protein [Ornithinimicrobium sp. F0845]MCK0113154.1 VOC family protein [Ornithinimicrobium sp. F0845]